MKEAKDDADAGKMVVRSLRMELSVRKEAATRDIVSVRLESQRSGGLGTARAVGAKTLKFCYRVPLALLKYDTPLV